MKQIINIILIQKAREGKWNGGFAPYGYSLINVRLEINEEETVAIRTILTNMCIPIYRWYFKTIGRKNRRKKIRLILQPILTIMSSKHEEVQHAGIQIS